MVIVLSNDADTVGLNWPDTHMRLLNAILSEMAEAVTITRTRDGMTLFVNRSFERLSGRQADELIGQPLMDVLPEGEGIGARLGEILTALSRCGHWEGEVTERTADGTLSLGQLRISEHTIPEHGTVWMGVRQDVTQRRQAETRYQALVESVPAVVYVSDCGADGRWRFISPQIESILGFPAEEWRGYPPLWKARLHPDDAGRVLRRGSEEMRAGRIDAEYRMLHRSGAVVWVQDRAVPVLVERDGPPQWHGVLLNVTEQKLAEQATEQAHRETITRLAMAIERRDFETAAHIERMSSYCDVIARRLGASDERRELIRVASSLHDVGKISVPDAILLKPGQLTPGERQQMERHAEVGYDVLRGGDSDLLALAAAIAWTHHERFDGSGYPRGLAGDEIPLEGRIAAVADVFDALSTNRVYRPAFPLDQVLEMMRSESGRHFDPAVLDAFLQNLDDVVKIVPSSNAAIGP